MKKIGITGVMGAGKSSVIDILKQKCFTILDCDRINDELLLKQHDGYMQLVEAFGNNILNEQEELDRKKMSDIIFSNPAKKVQVEQILHPLIKDSIIKELAKREKETLVFVEVPLLYEVGWESFFDDVWVIASDETLLLERLMKYRGIPYAEAKRRLSCQMSQTIKVSKADVIIWNNCDKEHLKQQIYDILLSNYEV